MAQMSVKPHSPVPDSITYKVMASYVTLSIYLLKRASGIRLHVECSAGAIERCHAAPALATLLKLDFNIISMFEAVPRDFKTENVRKNKNPA